MKLRNTSNKQTSISMEAHKLQYAPISTQQPSPRPATTKIPILPLIFLIFYEVSGGPFGIEDSVKAAGPLLALL
ncbi:hypothetical protein L1887_27738 [Cichorium endivia]|nr:hypothetical protein L1887_27738 [Cichorium endivia]